MDLSSRTTAPESATPSAETVYGHPSPSEEPRPKRRKVSHLYMVKQLERGVALGLDVRSICGAKVRPAYTPTESNLIEVVGLLVPLIPKEDCRRCAKAYTAYVRRTWEWHNR